jgi:hypothetical protein
MNKAIIIKLVVLLGLSVLLLSACGGDGESVPSPGTEAKGPISSSGDTSTTSSPGSSSNGSSTSASSGSSDPQISYLDCDALDPDKVYVFGQLDQGFLTGTDVIFAPEDPNTFCLGFKRGANDAGLITPSGNYIWASFPDVVRLVQDELLWNGEEWEYPRSPDSDDAALFEPVTTIGSFFLATETGDFFYRNHRKGEIYTSGSTEIYDWRAMRNTLLGVTPNGDLVFGHGSGVTILQADKTDIDATNPDGLDSGLDFGGRMKLFNDPASGNLSAWLYVEYKDDTENRWTIDLVNLSITDDGQYAAIPDGVTITVNPVDQNVFDGQGNLWQQGYIVEGETRYDVIIKRPLASSSMASTVEYSEASNTGGLDWKVETSPYAVINHSSPLFTGP